MLGKTLRIMQANLNRSVEATETALELAVRENVDLLAIQEPWMLHKQDKGYTRSIAHPATQPLLPQRDKDTRPRTVIYTRLSLSIQITQLPLNNPDIQVVTLQSSSGEKLQLVNVYNEKDASGRYTTKSLAPPVVPQKSKGRPQDQTALHKRSFQRHTRQSQ